MMIDKHSFPDEANVIVIGAGPAGLAMGGCLRMAGVPFVILESSGEVGTRWRQHYDRLHLHTTARFSALPGMPYPASYPRYPSRQQFVDYLDAYARKFQLEPRFHQAVTSIQRAGDQWEIHTTDSVYCAPNLVVATGLSQQPYSPQWPGQETYRGTIFHSRDYKNGDPFQGKRVLVVGFGNSGAEIAVDLYERGAQPSLSVRGPVNVISREMLGIPSQYLSVLLRGLPAWLLDALTAPLNSLKFGDLPRYGLRKLPYGAVTQINTQSRIPVIDIGTIPLIKQGHITVYPGIDRFTEDGVIFVGGKQISFDAVILATGYRTGLASILPSGYALVDEKGYPVHSGQPTAAPGLYFCGFDNSPVGLLRIIALEAKEISRHIVETERQRT